MARKKQEAVAEQPEQAELLERAGHVSLTEDVKAMIESGLLSQAEKLVLAHEKRKPAANAGHDIVASRLRKALATAKGNSYTSAVVRRRILKPEEPAEAAAKAAGAKPAYKLEAGVAQRTILLLFSEGLLSEEYTKKINDLMSE